MSITKNWQKGLLSLGLSTSVLLFSTNNASADSTRRDLKKMCKEQKQICLDQGTERKMCRELWVECRKENHVSFADDLAYIQEQIDVLLKKAVASVELSLGEDEVNGEYLDITVRSKHFNVLPAFSYEPPGLESSLALIPMATGQSELHVKLDSTDFEQNGVGSPLQITPGESFPLFLDNRVFESLWGVGVDIGKLDDIQMYIDGSEKVTGLFVPVKEVGLAFDELNNLKSRIPVVGDLVPDLKLLPFPLKYKGEKVGKFYLMGKNSQGDRAGILYLVDHQKIMEILKRP